MDELSEGELDDIRAFIENEDGSYPESADLVARWDSLSPDARAPGRPNYLTRDVLIWSYSNWAFKRRWAWDGLNQLLITLEDRREPIPKALKDWAYSVVSRQARGTFKAPDKMRNPEFGPKDDRDMRIMRVYDILREDGWSEEKAEDNIMIALGGDDLRHVFRKMRDFHPFKR